MNLLAIVCLPENMQMLINIMTHWIDMNAYHIISTTPEATVIMIPSRRTDFHRHSFFVSVGVSLWPLYAPVIYNQNF